jgi:uncharacterized membrane protein
MAEPERPPLVSLWDLAALLGFGALWLWYQALLPSLPDPVPTHFNARGLADGFTSKAALPMVIFGLPVGVWAVVTALGMVLGATRKEPAAARALAMAPLRGLLGLGLAFLMGACLASPLHGVRTVALGAGVFLACLLVGIVFQIREAARIPACSPGDEHWRWGVFYVNPDDPRLMVEKRLGLGWTLNFGRPGSWGLLALLLLPAFVVIVLVAAFKR